MLPSVKRATSMKAMHPAQLRVTEEQSGAPEPLPAHVGGNDGRPSMSLRKTLATREAAEREKRRKKVFGKLDVLGADLDRIRSDLEGARKKTRYIRAKVLKARNLPGSEDRKIDPYVKLTIDRLSVTSQHQGDMNPTWNEVLILAVKIPIIPPTLLVEVFDHDSMGVQQDAFLRAPSTQGDKDLPIATCEVCLSSMMEDEKPICRSFTLQSVPRRGRSKEAAEGEKATISLDLSFMSASEARRHMQGTHRTMKRGSMLTHIPLGLVKEDSTEKGVRPERENHLKEDSVRMLLVGHMGRLRHGASEVRRLAVASIAKTAGERGKDLPKSGYWDAQVVKCLTERMEKDSVLEVRLDAMDAMGFVSKEGNADAIRVLCKALKDSSREVRLAAVNTLLRVVKGWNDVAINAMGECLEDPDHGVRAAACAALPRLSSVFDIRLIKQAMDRMSSLHAVVRQAAVKALASVTTAGSPVVIEGLSKAVSDVDPQVKVTAMEELTKQVHTGHAQVIQLIAEQLRDSRPLVRRTATTCLESLVIKGDKIGLGFVLGGMDDPGKDQYGHLAVQVAALRALQAIAIQERPPMDQFSPRTERKMFDSIIGKISSSDWCVRREVAISLRVCSAGNEDEALHRLLTLLEDEVQEVRNDASQTVLLLAAGRLDWIKCALSCLLASPNGTLRGVSSSLLLALLPEVADGDCGSFLAATKQGMLPTHADVISFLLELSVQRGDGAALKGFVGCLDHHDAHVRSLAMDCLKCFTHVGQEHVITDLISRLRDRGPDQIIDTAIALSRVVEVNDERAVKAIMELLESEHREVRAVVHRALQNTLPEGDARITIASACLRLEPEFHTEQERKEALRQLAQLAYASHHTRVQGWSVEDADLQAFWQLIRQPRRALDEASRLLPRIMKRLADENVWVRTAAVQAARECGVRGDAEVVEALQALLPDESFAVRTAVVQALSVIAPLSDSKVIFALGKTLNDVSHLVRMASVKALRVLVKVGDRQAARALMSWFRRAWEYLATRGNDTDIKLETARLLIDILSIGEMDKCRTFVNALSSTNLHYQRNEIASFDDFLVQHNLIESYMEYEHRVSSRSADTLADPDGKYGTHQVKAIVMIQQWANKRITASSDAPKRQSWTANARKAIKSSITVQSPAPEEAQRAAKVGEEHRKAYSSSHLEKEDQMAEKILRRIVPLDVRSAAIAAAHERSQDAKENLKLWDKMRWTERLRLCEEVARRAWPL